MIISNCVINLSGHKPAVLHEAARVLRPGGRFAVTDIVADTDMDGATRADMQQWTGCIAGALTAEESRPRAPRGGLRGGDAGGDPPRPRARRLGDHPRPGPGPITPAAPWPRSSSTTRRRSTAAGRTRSGARSRSTSSATTRQWAELSGEDRDLIYWVLASLTVAEERITTKFAGLVGASRRVRVPQPR